MNLAVHLGLASALFFGGGDFLARFSSRQFGLLRPMLFGHALLAVLFTLQLVAQRSALHASVWAWLVLLTSNAALMLATVCLYRALVIGNLVIVAPVTACYGAVAALLSVLTGERLSALSSAGVLMTLAGGIAAAVPERRKNQGAVRTEVSGSALAAAAAVFFGVGFWLQGRYAIPTFGTTVPVWSYYVFGTGVLLALGIARRADLRPPTVVEVPVFLGPTLLGGAGYLALAIGQSLGPVGVVTALSCLASAVTVLFARVVLRESVALHGWVGLVVVVVGLTFLHLT